MADVLRVLWTITPRFAPQPWLNCSRCGEVKPFQSGQAIRVNANGRRLDAWLIYKCTTCDNTWNRPILERRSVGTIDPRFLAALQANDPDLVRRLAFDVEDLRRRQERVEEFAQVLVQKHVLSQATPPARRLEIRLAAPEPTGLRADRLLATELGLARDRIRDLWEKGRLVASADSARVLRRPVRDRMCFALDLSQEPDGDRIAVAARGVPS